ncbi:hypothetical protein [Paucilactobacillus sp. N302-9]
MIEKNENKKYNNILYLLNIVFFCVNIGYLVIYNSNLKISYPSPTLKYISYGLLFLNLSSGLFYIVFSKIKLLRLIFLICLLMISTVLIIKGQLAVAMVFIYAVCAQYFSFHDVVKIYFVGTLIGFLSVVGLATLGFISMRDPRQGLLTFGFQNPNTTGLYVALMLMYLIILKNKNILLKFLFVLGMMVNIFILNDSTATLMMTIFVVLAIGYKLVDKMFHLKVIAFFSSLIPFLLWIASIGIAKNYGYSNFFMKLNELLTNRPYLWNFYYTNFPPKAFLQNINPNDIYLSQLPSNGAFDGAYISFTVNYGYVLALMLTFLLCLLIWRSIKNENKWLVILTLSLVFTGFTEGILFSAFQNPIIVLAVAIYAKEWFIDSKEIKS